MCQKHRINTPEMEYPCRSRGSSKHGCGAFCRFPSIPTHLLTAHCIIICISQLSSLKCKQYSGRASLVVSGRGGTDPRTTTASSTSSSCSTQPVEIPQDRSCSSLSREALLLMRAAEEPSYSLTGRGRMPSGWVPTAGGPAVPT